VAALVGVAAGATGHAAEIIKDNNTSALNTTGSWVGGVLPGANDIVVWDGALVAPIITPLGGDVAWQGIKITNVQGARNAANNVTISNAASPNTITLGSGGIDMSAALQTLVIQSRLQLSANQTWAVSNANTAANPAGLSQNEDLALFAQAAAVPINLGGFTVTKTGDGTVAVTSGYTISNGNFVVNQGILHIQGGSNRVTTVTSDVNFTVNTGGLLRFAAQSGAGGLTTQNNAPITMNGGTLTFFLNQNNALNMTGNITVNGPVTWTAAAGGYSSAFATLSANLIGSGSIAYQNGATNNTGFLRMTGDNSGFTGTINLNGTTNNRSLRLSSPTAGSAAATWTVGAGNTLQVDGVEVQLGTLNGAGTVTNPNANSAAGIQIGQGSFTGILTNGAAQPLSVTKVGPGTAELLGQNLYTGNTTVNGGTLVMAADFATTTPVTVADGARFTTRVTVAGIGLNVPSLTVGTTTGGTLGFDVRDLGNPTAPVVSAGLFTANGPTKLQVLGSNLTNGTFTLLDYTGTIGGGGFAGLSLTLPPRVFGSLVNNTGNSSVDVTITGQDTPKWTGAVNGNWDIDNGAGGGTSNWREVVSGNTTKYLQPATGGDKVLFDDTATGATNVNLTTTLLPTDVVVNNTTKNYTFSGTGKISGTTKLTKSGTGTLVLTNTGGNDYTGVTRIDAGVLQVGDGTTVGAGSLGVGPVDVVGGTLILNRPDDFAIPEAVTGAGTLTKNAAGVATLSLATNFGGPVVINAGTLRLAAGGSLTGIVSGAGTLTTSGGTLTLGGTDPNPITGPVTVTAGTLLLQKGFGVRAVSDQVIISGTGSLNATAGEQIPDTATVTSNSDGGNSTIGNETLANIIMNGASGVGSQIIANTGLVVSDTVTLNGRIFSVASGNSATVNRVVMTNGILRVAANSGPSQLDIGAGGINASGGTIEVGQGTGAFDAVVNLGGDVTTTGNLEINRGNFTGLEKREINLGANRVFNIGTGTTTNVRPDVAGVGGLTKSGTGVLNLLGAVTYQGPTVVSAGTLNTSTAQTGTTAVTVGDGANFNLRVASAGSALVVPTLTLGSTTGGRITFDLGALGNPTLAPISAAAFSTRGTSNLTIVGGVSSGTIPLIDYDGTIGGGGFGSLSVTLPVRVVGNLVNNTAASRVDLNIVGIDTPKWVGNVSSTWDIDDGTGTGTANWKGALSGSALKYQQTALGNDPVLLDDSATGPTKITIAAPVSPSAVVVNNITKTYELEGPGKISGPGKLTKQGAGKLIIRTNNDNTGGTSIEAGTIELGGGAAGGSLGSGAVTNNGTLIFNRTDNALFSHSISGPGALIKRGATSEVTLTSANPLFDGETRVEAGRLNLSSATGLGSSVGATIVSSGAAVSFVTSGTAATVSEPITISGTGAFSENNGALRFGSNGLTLDNSVTLAANAAIGVDAAGQTATINATISGAGTLTKVGAGTLTLGGFESNTYAGTTTVEGGTLQMNKQETFNAVPGDVVVNAGAVNWSLPNQLPDTASVTINTGSMNTGNRADIVRNVTINPATPVSTFSGLTITGTLTVNAGTHDAVNSNGVLTAAKVVLTNSIIRMGINGGPSTMTIGAGGLAMTDASIMYGSVGNAAQTGTVFLEGNVTGNGVSGFDINTGNPISLLDLGAQSRTFDIASGTTTVRPVVQSSTSAAGITKVGPGTLVLSGSNTYGGDTLVQAGTVDVRGSISASARVVVSTGATLDVQNAAGGFQVSAGQTLAGTGTVSGNSTVIGRLAPGQGIGTMAFQGDLQLAGDAAFEINKT
jgi:autotransporter-associated beta strand protein